ncbi:MAG: hypothetical protein LGB53_07140 [Sulfurovum sp.]|nr:hypothetical protein [Sulfurovum sp.]
MEEDIFANKSKNWDMNSKRIRNTRNITELIVKNIKLNHNMELMDFGTGTGLSGFFIAFFLKQHQQLVNLKRIYCFLMTVYRD